MISTDQWRAVIGCFSPRHHRARLATRATISTNFRKVRMCLQLAIVFALAITISGDVETNPGPTIEEQFKSLTEFVGERLDVINSNIVELRSELSKIQEELESKINTLHTDIDANADAISRIESRLDQVDIQLDKQEQYSRRENVILHGVAESTDEDENYSTMRTKCINIINSNLSHPLVEDDIVRAHRLGKHTNPEKPRPIILRFKNFMDKLSVLKTRQRLKENGIGIANDLTRKQRSELQTLRDRGERGYYKNGQLVTVRQDNQQQHRSYVSAVRRLDHPR